MEMKLLHAVATQQPDDVALAQDCRRKLLHVVLGEPQPVSLSLRHDGKEEQMVVPASAIRLMYEYLRYIDQTISVAILANRAELTAEQASDVLHVSVPYLVGLLEAGTIPHRTAESGHRVRLQAVIDFKRENDERRHKALDELTAHDQALGLYD